ncbi:tRNA (adenosine(37)-N6)-dimethylallyltransferase MiaA [Radiobacillus kanasensis]|uniref:tRNA (adenosine(37)-N6)-dimethylallyltransferase MiaA n=1 Tax=Radiobacillus kanasensis TaxID=2844358 RepID=UPI001E60D62D|nr:tRNA (adenosine(37)-N6)-dimethylallyltransferase MiaA [Radiobacillus kanasensis]UFU01113.1 tRNA (adenosine(37)-N6)-dimethylallyltransferase MiaA [Radiobacillus kanasensis]
MKQQVVVIVGPTAVGKTALSVEIAKAFQGEIISGDSMQIYKGMDIGTAKVTEEERQGIPHYLIDFKQPDESFSVAEFQNLVEHSILEISQKGKLPIIAGGTGLYIQAALYGYEFSETKRNDTYQKKIEKEIELQGTNAVYERLKKVDPIQAEKVHPNNTRRLVRALEVYDRTGQTMTENHEKQLEESKYEPILIGLEMERSRLYERINLRVDQMIEQGLMKEVEYFYTKGLTDSQSMKAIGYKEFIPYFEGEQSEEKSIELLKRNSRRYAKRQMTWFKNKMNVDWYSILPETKETVFQNILSDLAGKIR